MTPELGLIEGYYGGPRTRAERGGQARVLKDHGHGVFPHPPKADPFLRRRWREDYPQGEADALAKMASLCAAIGVSFGVGFSPFEVYRSFDAVAKAALARKLAFFDAVGITELSILFDDMRADVPDLAETQAAIVGWMAERTAARRIIVCPTLYS